MRGLFGRQGIEPLSTGEIMERAVLYLSLVKVK